MSLSEFMIEIEENSELCLNSVSSEHHFSIECSGFLKSAEELSDAESVTRSVMKKYELSEAEYDFAVKIASEVEEISLALRISPTLDDDYLLITKEAGVPSNGQQDSGITNFINNIANKLNSGERLSDEEEMITMSGSFQKIAGMKDFFGGKMLSAAGGPASKPMLGSVGSAALASVPVVAGASYLSGRSSGKDSKEQEIANQIAERLRSRANALESEGQEV